MITAVMNAIANPIPARIFKNIGFPEQSPFREAERNELLLHTMIPELISRNGV